MDVQVFGETEDEESRPVAGTVAYPADRHDWPYLKRWGGELGLGAEWEAVQKAPDV